MRLLPDGFDAGGDPEQPRHDLKRPWDAVTKRARLTGVRLHGLRHTDASFGAGGGLGLPIIGRLLGHAQAVTTARYAHLDDDPLRRASAAIAGRIAAALEGSETASARRASCRALSVVSCRVTSLISTSNPSALI